MATMNVSLPDPMKAWVESQIHSGKYANVSDYVRDLIRHDQQEREKLNQLRTAIEVGRQSGISRRSREGILAEAKAELKHAGL